MKFFEGSKKKDYCLRKEKFCVAIAIGNWI